MEHRSPQRGPRTRPGSGWRRDDRAWSPRPSHWLRQRDGHGSRGVTQLVRVQAIEAAAAAAGVSASAGRSGSEDGYGTGGCGYEASDWPFGHILRTSDDEFDHYVWRPAGAAEGQNLPFSVAFAASACAAALNPALVHVSQSTQCARSGGSGTRGDLLNPWPEGARPARSSRPWASGTDYRFLKKGDR
jgi:hypothetical protein